MNNSNYTDPSDSRPGKRQPRWYHLLGVYIVMIAFTLFGAYPLQANFGMLGLALTEIALLALAVGAAVLFRFDLKKTFPMSLPPIKSFFGSLSLYIATYLLITIIEMFVLYFFPQDVAVAETLTAFTEGIPPSVAMLVIAILPAICEEPLHRGLYLSCLGKIKYRPLMIFISGLLFGIFHLDPQRLFTTTALGMLFAYLVLETGSMLLPMIFHLMTNLFSVIVLYIPQVDVTEEIADSPAVTVDYNSIGIIGSCALVYLGLIILFGYVGLRLFDKIERNSRRKSVVIVVSMALMLAGYYFMGMQIVPQLYETMPDMSAYGG